MDWLVSAAWWLCATLFTLLRNYAVLPLVNVYAGYIFYSLAIWMINVAIKLRYEVYNQDLKYEPSECKNKLVLVTGATSGIGLAVTRYLHSIGFHVVACCFNTDEPGYVQLEDIAANYDNSKAHLSLVELDVRSQESIEKCHRCVREILDSSPGLRMHALINAAGLGHVSKFQWQQRDMIKRILETNLVGAIMLTRELMPLIVRGAPDSRVVFVSSPFGKFNHIYNSVYGATKAGLSQFAHNLRLDLLDYDVKTVAIYPGNLIRNTSIIDSSLTDGHKSVLDSLNDEEKCLYEQELAKHEQFLHIMKKARFGPTRSLIISMNKSLKSNLVKIGLLTSGAIGKEKLEESNLMNSFDNAIRVKNPPRDIFAGNRWFEIGMGAWFEIVCPQFLRDCSYFISKNVPTNHLLG